jgi:hypothetical protein
MKRRSSSESVRVKSPEVEHLTERTHAGPASHLVERLPQPFWIDEIELVRLVDRGFERLSIEPHGHVDEGADRRGDW